MRFSSQGVGGHRGWPSRYPDNTLEGISAAAEVADLVELDVRASADGRFALAHDPEIAGRTVADTTWDVLSALDVGGGLHPTTLDAVMAALSDLPLDIEIKNSPFEASFDADHVVARQVANLARPIDVMTSFYWPTMDAVRRSHPDVSTGLLVDERGSVDDAVAHAVDLGHRLIAPHWSLIDETAIRRAAAEDLVVVTWTVNDTAEALRLLELGVHAIITDDPGALRAALQEAS